MATFGQGINPQLGAIDYSAFSRGAAQQAQGVMQGGQGIANGIAQLGQQIGGAIQEYNQKQEVKKKEEMAINAFISFANQNPREAQALGLQKDQKTGSWDKKAVGHVVKSLGGAGAALGVASQLTQAKQAQEQQQAELEIARKRAATERMRAGIDFLQATGRGQQQGQMMNLKQLQGLKQQGFDAKATPIGPDQFLVTGVSPFAPPAQTTINTGDTGKMKLEAFKQLQSRRDSDINPIISARPQIDAMEGLLNAVDKDGKVITGALANLELKTKSLLNATGLSDFKDVAATQQYLGNSATLVGQIIKQFGAGTGLSDADREFATKAAAGQITMEKAALKRLVSIARKVAKDKVSLYNKTVKQTFAGEEDKDDIFGRNSLLIQEEEAPAPKAVGRFTILEE